MTEPRIQVVLKRSEWEALFLGAEPGSRLMVAQWNARARALEEIRKQLAQEKHEREMADVLGGDE